MVRSVLARISFCISALACSGCADLTVTRLQQAGNPPLVGQFTYSLPRTAITVALTVAVTQCDGYSSSNDGTGEAGKASPGKNDIAFKVSATATPAIEADPDHVYAIDYRDAETWMKEINFTLNTTPNKVFQSFNGTINDQVGPIAVAALTAAVQIAGSVIIPGAPIVHAAAHAPAPAPAAVKNYCTTDVDKALQTVLKDQAEIKQLNKRLGDYRKSIAGAVTPGKNDPTTGWAEAVTALQNDITSTTSKSLSRSMTVTWVPSPSDMITSKDRPDVFVGHYQLPISNMVAALLSEDALGSWYNNPALQGPADAWYAAHAPYILTVAIDSQTYADPSKVGAANIVDQPGGILIRDPALGIIQRCKPPKGKTAPLIQDAQGVWAYDTKPLVDPFSELCRMPSLRTADTSSDSDDSTRVALSVPQFGRALVFTAHSGLFQNASLTMTLNADGTIQSVGTHALSTAATGLSGFGTAASAASSAEAAHNTAVGAVNTATLNQIQLRDNKNKALADCIQQAATIVKSGLTPGNCQ